MGLSEYLETQIFTYLKGTGVSEFSANETFEVALFSTSLTNAGAGTEITGVVSNLARQPVTFIDGTFTNHVQNDGVLNFGSNDSGSSISIQAVGIYDSTNNFIGYQNLASPVDVPNGSIVKISAGNLRFYIDRTS